MPPFSTKNKLLVALYSKHDDAESGALISKGLEFATSTFSRFHCDIDSGAYVFKTLPFKLKNYKCYRYSRSKKTLLMEVANSNLQRVSLYALPDSSAVVSFEWNLVMEFGCLPESSLDFIQVGLDIGIAGANKIPLFELVSEFCASLNSLLPRACYGFASVMPADYMPMGYATGLVGKAPEELVYDANAWRNGFGTDMEHLRNVHGYNLLGGSILEQNVEDATLKNWILAGNGSRGTLVRFSETLHGWSFGHSGNLDKTLEWDSIEVASIRNQLKGKGIFPWQQWLAKKYK